MALRKIIAFAVLFMFAIALPASAQTVSACAKLTRNLKVGAEGADVKVLQQILNKNKVTRIADTGPGSPGQESEYFGKKTTAAMIRFQDLYKKEVLTPAGLTKGTGFVGSYSRAKLKTLCLGATSSKKKSTVATGGNPTWETNTTPEMTPAEATLPENFMDDANRVAQKPNVFVPMKITKPWVGDGNFPTPEIAMVSEIIMNPGDTFTIYGVGFTGDTPNTLHFGTTKYSIKNLGVDETGVITFTVPSDVPRGRHFLRVSNRKGESGSDVFVVVPTPGRPGPTVKLSTPKAGKTGGVVTMYGTGFATTWNDILFPTAVVKGVASRDGKTLSFVIPQDDFELTPESAKIMPDIESTFSVVNDYGISDNIPFTVQF